MTREQVAEVAYRRFRDGGFDAVSLRGVAGDVGVTAPALYRIFEGKGDLVAAGIERGLRHLHTRLTGALVADEPRERLQRTMSGLLEFALAEPRIYQTLAYPSQEPGVQEVVNRLHGVVVTVVRFLTDRVRECMDAEVLRPDSPERVALVLWSGSHGLISTWLSGHLPLHECELRELYQEFGRLTVAGVGVRADG
ncbi:TetR/AcrR family transcriptional regulator [Gaopeijia maritima]|uniref:TetR/AcrR family transcriptional regulator n=1 Tax=Gaopeijia maritima TaxID=3119007 RepID=UPI003248E5EE